MSSVLYDELFAPAPKPKPKAKSAKPAPKQKLSATRAVVIIQSLFRGALARRRVRAIRAGTPSPPRSPYVDDVDLLLRDLRAVARGGGTGDASAAEVAAASDELMAFATAAHRAILKESVDCAEEDVEKTEREVVALEETVAKRASEFQARQDAEARDAESREAEEKARWWAARQVSSFNALTMRRHARAVREECAAR